MESDGQYPPALDDDEPITELASYEEDGVSPEFIDGLKRRLHRRAATAHVASVFWELPKAVFIELASMLGRFFGDDARKEDRR